MYLSTGNLGALPGFQPKNWSNGSSSPGHINALDYFLVVDPESLEPIADITGQALVAVAAYLGATRLIDNIVVKA